MKLGDFLNNIAAKCGIQNNSKIVDLLSNSEMARIELDDDTAGEIDKQLMTIEGAKNNTAVKAHFVASALAGVDTELLNMAEVLGLGDEVLTTLKSTNKDTYGNLRKLSEAAKTALSQKGQKSPKEEDFEALKREIKDLNSKLAGEKERQQKELADISQAHEKQLMDYGVSSLIAAKNFAASPFPTAIQQKLAKELLYETLGADGIMLAKSKDGKIALKRADNPELDYYDANNKGVAFDDYVNSVLAKNNLLAVSTPQAPQVSHQNQPNQANAATENMTGFMNAVASARADLGQAVALLQALKMWR